jgi:hypothetical protein
MIVEIGKVSAETKGIGTQLFDNPTVKLMQPRYNPPNF